MPATQYGIDYGDIAKINLLYQEQARQQQEDNQKQQYQNSLRQTASAAASGQEGAVQQFAYLYSKEAKETFEGLKALGQAQRDKVAQFNDFVGSAATELLQTSPDQQEGRYQQVRSQMPKEIQAEMPANFDAGYLQTKLNIATGTKALMDMNFKTSEREASQDFTANQNALSRNNTTKNTLIAHSEAQQGAKASDISLIDRQVDGLFGDLYSPITGKVSITDKQKRQQALGVKTEAERLYNSGVPRNEAVSRAATAYGISIPSGQNTQSSPGVPNETKNEILTIGSKDARGRTVVSVGKGKTSGRTIVKYSDGTQEYADQ